MKIKYLLLLFVLGGMGIACSKSDPKEEDSSTTDPQKSTLKVMTYNIHIGNPPAEGEGVVDLEAIADVIKQANPDLVALQEVDRFTDRSGKDLDQAKTLGDLTDMHYYFAKAIDRSNGEYGVAVLSKFPILESETFSLPVNQGTDAELRAAGLVQVQLANEQRILFVATHLDQKAESNRALQARELLKVLKPYSAYPVIIGGDFNMPPESDTWNIIETEFQMGCSTCPSTFSASNPTTTIDYLLLNTIGLDYFSIKSYDVILEREASDHLPLVAELEYEVDSE